MTYCNDVAVANDRVVHLSIGAATMQRSNGLLPSSSSSTSVSTTNPSIPNEPNSGRSVGSAAVDMNTMVNNIPLILEHIEDIKYMMCFLIDTIVRLFK
jgi:hypothetical protein